MRIVKVFNNNVVQATNAQEEDFVVMGRGIGFQKKTGDSIDESRIEKTFISEVGDSVFSEIYRDIPPEEIELVLDIIKLAEERIGENFQANLYLTLADHLNFALERHRQGLPLRNPLSWEVRRLYKQEYEIGLEALKMINERFNIDIAEDEAASIALHLVNAQKEGQLIEETMKMVEIVQDILNIVRIHFSIEFDEESISFSRFVTHLQFFAKRVIDNIQHGSNDTFLFEQVQASYPEAFKCAEKIKHYVQSTYDHPVGRDETVYLTIHIQRLTSKN